jgi:hypothetical protein
MIKTLMAAIEFRRLIQGVSELTSPEARQMLDAFQLKHPDQDMRLINQWAFPKPRQRVIESIARGLELAAKQLRKYR